MGKLQISDQYIHSLPSHQNALDIFQGEWSSKLPQNLDHLNAGKTPLFEDPRVSWAIEKLGGLNNKSVLELGPLEAGHTYMLEKAGAKEIRAVESNSHAYLKCLIVKEILNLRKSKFLCGNFVEYLKQTNDKFDVCWASGVLYHMTHPVELLAKIANVSNQIYLWTHYFDRDIIVQKQYLVNRFDLAGIPSRYQNFPYSYYKQKYETSLPLGFCGGSQPFSYWMSRNDIISCLKFFGFNKIEVDPNCDLPNHPHGPCFGLMATR